MSFDLKRTHFSLTLEKKVTSGVLIPEEGLLLVRVMDAATGEERVEPSAGAASEVPVGFSVRDNADYATTSAVETAVIPSTGTLTVTLDNNQLVGTAPNAQLRVVASVTGVLTQVAGAPAAGQVQVNAATGLLTFNAAQAGQTVTVTYRYNLTVAESRLKFFQRNINNAAGALFEQVGVGMGHGEIYTDAFDATVDWAAVTQPKSGASGTIVNSGSGTNLDARVISVPNTDNPLLGLAFNLGGN